MGRVEQEMKALARAIGADAAVADRARPPAAVHGQFSD
jgi:hypothetical protein